MFLLSYYFIKYVNADIWKKTIPLKYKDLFILDVLKYNLRKRL